LEYELDEVDAAAQGGAAHLDAGEMVAATVRIGRIVAQLQRQERHQTAHGVVARRRPRGQQIRIDVVAAELLEAVRETAAQVLGMVGGLLGTEQLREELALDRVGGAAPIALEADLVLALAEDRGLARPGSAEQPRLAILDLGALTPLAHALGDAGA